MANYKTKWAVKSQDGEWCVSPSAIAERIDVPLSTIRGQINRGVVPSSALVSYKSNKVVKVSRWFVRVSYASEYYGAEFPELVEQPQNQDLAQVISACDKACEELKNETALLGSDIASLHESMLQNKTENQG